MLVLTGSEPDQWGDLPADVRTRRLAALRDARHEVVAGAGHYVHVEQPEATLELVRGFLA